MQRTSRIDMCQALVPVPADIGIHSTDEELLLFLEGMKVGDPTPANVITDVDPSSVEPWNFPEGLLFMYNPEGSNHHKGECETNVTRSGYWRQIDDLKILTGACTFGRKIVLEFYKGKEPFGERTAWMMHKYVAEQHILNGSNYSKDYSFLCRVFQQTNRRESQGKQSNSLGAGESVGEYVNRMLLSLLEQEERTASDSQQTNRRESQGKRSNSLGAGDSAGEYVNHLLLSLLEQEESTVSNSQQINRRESQGKQSNSLGAGESVGEYVKRMLLSLLEQEERTVNDSQQTNRRESQGKQSNSLGSGDSVGEYVNRMLLSLLEQEESTANNSQIVAENEQGPSALSSRKPDEPASDSRKPDEPVSDNAAMNIYEFCDFSNEEYMELNDIYSTDTPASSDNSSLMSVSDEEYFDPVSTGAKEESTNFGFSICPPARSNKVFIGPSPSGSIDNDVLAVEEGNPASWLVRSEPALRPRNCSASNDLQQNGKASSASRQKRDEVSHTGHTSHRQSSKGNGSNSIRKIAKIGKRYCCFGSF